MLKYDAKEAQLASILIIYNNDLEEKIRKAYQKDIIAKHFFNNKANRQQERK